MPVIEIPGDNLQNVPVDVILKMVGYPEPKVVDEEVKTNIRNFVKLATKEGEAKVLYQESTFEIIDNTVKLAIGQEFNSEKLVDKVRGCDGIILAVMTMGKKLDERINELMAGDIFNGYLLDTISSYMVEKVSEIFWRQLVVIFDKRKMKITSFISPGSKEFPLDYQKKVFNYLQPETIGVRLLDSMLIEPSKSLTVMMGFGKNIEAAKKSHNCNECDMKDCLLRGLH